MLQIKFFLIKNSKVILNYYSFQIDLEFWNVYVIWKCLRPPSVSYWFHYRSNDHDAVTNSQRSFTNVPGKVLGWSGTVNGWNNERLETPRYVQKNWIICYFFYIQIKAKNTASYDFSFERCSAKFFKWVPWHQKFRKPMTYSTKRKKKKFCTYHESHLNI